MPGAGGASPRSTGEGGWGEGGFPNFFVKRPKLPYLRNTPVILGGLELCDMSANLHIRRVLPAARRRFADGLRIGGATPNYVEHRTG